MDSTNKTIRLNGQWTLIHESSVAKHIGVTEDIFDKYFLPVIPQVKFGSSIYYATFDINWRIQQLRKRSFL